MEDAGFSVSALEITLLLFLDEEQLCIAAIAINKKPTLKKDCFVLSIGANLLPMQISLIARQ